MSAEDETSWRKWWRDHSPAERAAALQAAAGGKVTHLEEDDDEPVGVETYRLSLPPYVLTWSPEDDDRRQWRGTDTVWDFTCWAPSATEQTELATAPVRVLRFHPVEWPGLTRDAAYEAWRLEQASWLTANTQPMELRHLDWEWKRRKAAALAALPDRIVGFHVDDWPDLPDPEAAWATWGQARRDVLATLPYTTAAHLDLERRRRWPADRRAAHYDKAATA